MRTYQLSRNTPSAGAYKDIISNPMNCDDFLKYLKDDDKANERNVFTKINLEYLNSLNIGKNKYIAFYDIHVNNISVKKMRIYTLDNGIDLCPSDYNVSSLDKFKTVLTTFYNEIIKRGHKISIKLEDIIDTKYLTSLLVWPNSNTIYYCIINNAGEKINKQPFHFNIYVSEFEIE